MTAVKPTTDKPHRRLHLASGTESYADDASRWGWKVAKGGTGLRTGDILLIDVATGEGAVADLLERHRGPVVAIIDEGDGARLATLVAQGVSHFAPRNDKLLLRAALEAASALAQQSVPRGRRQGDVATDRLFDWLVDIADRGDEATLLLADFGGVERVNASHGRAIGDLLLLRASRRLAAFLRRTEMTGAALIRIGPQRYGLAVPLSLASQRIDFLLNELLSELSRPYVEHDEDIHLPAAVAACELKSGEAASRCVSRAMSLLDRAGGLNPAIASEGCGKARMPRYDEHQIEKDLRHAVKRGEIEIVYQPQFAFDGDRLVGAEALARWNHDKYGPLGAGVLFSVAARSDYLVPLSHYIQERVLSEAGAWAGAASSLRLSLNVTPQDLAQPGFLDGFLAKLEASGLEPRRLTVEITETGLMGDIEANAKLLSRLRERGIAVAVDDFGTGYSSLAWLKDLPLDYMKLDQGLTADILTQDRGRIVVQSVIAMGRALGLKIVAEGVESEAQRALLAAEGCDFYQGFVRAPALSAADFAAFASDNA